MGCVLKMVIQLAQRPVDSPMTGGDTGFALQTLLKLVLHFGGRVEHLIPERMVWGWSVAGVEQCWQVIGSVFCFQSVYELLFSHHLV